MTWQARIRPLSCRNRAHGPILILCSLMCGRGGVWRRLDASGAVSAAVPARSGPAHQSYNSWRRPVEISSNFLKFQLKFQVEITCPGPWLAFVRHLLPSASASSQRAAYHQGVDGVSAPLRRHSMGSSERWPLTSFLAGACAAPVVPGRRVAHTAAQVSAAHPGAVCAHAPAWGSVPCAVAHVPCRPSGDDCLRL